MESWTARRESFIPTGKPVDDLGNELGETENNQMVRDKTGQKMLIIIRSNDFL